MYGADGGVKVFDGGSSGSCSVASKSAKTRSAEATSDPDATVTLTA